MISPDTADPLLLTSLPVSSTRLSERCGQQLPKGNASGDVPGPIQSVKSGLLWYQGQITDFFYFLLDKAE